MHSFSCGSDDRETPLRAVQDLSTAVAVFLARDTSSVRVYDPYYCRGGIIGSLARCGFSADLIINEDKDCYVVQKTRQVPENDIVITNPPYSGQDRSDIPYRINIMYDSVVVVVCHSHMLS